MAPTRARSASRVGTTAGCRSRFRRRRLQHWQPSSNRTRAVAMAVEEALTRGDIGHEAPSMETQLPSPETQLPSPEMNSGDRWKQPDDRVSRREDTRSLGAFHGQEVPPRVT